MTEPFDPDSFPSIPEIDNALVSAYIEADEEARTDQRFDPVRRFRVDSLSKAAWVSSRYKNACDRIAEHEAVVKAEIERLRAWFDDATRDDARTVQWAEALLIEYALDQRELTGRATTKLPHASVRTTLKPARPVIADETALLDWAEENAPDAVKVTRKVLISELDGLTLTPSGAVVSEAGEVVPGLGVVEETISASVKII